MLMQAIALALSICLGGCGRVFLEQQQPDATLVASESGMVKTLARTRFAHGLSVNERYVYFAGSDFARQDNVVGRVELTSGEVTTLSSTEAPVQNVAAINDDEVVWTTWFVAGMRGTIRGRALAANPTPTTLATIAGGNSVFSIAPADGALLLPTFDTGEVFRRTSVIGGVLPPAFTLPAPAANWRGVTSSVVDGGELFWTNQATDSSGGVFSSPVGGGGAQTTWVLDSKAPWGLVVTSDYIVYSRRGELPGEAAIVRVSRTDKSVLTLAQGRSFIRGISTDDRGDIYFGEHILGGSIWKVPIDGSAPATEVVVNQASPLLVIATSDAIYWTNYDAINGAVMQMKK